MNSLNKNKGDAFIYLHLFLSDFLNWCGDKDVARSILRSPNKEGDVNCIFIFGMHFSQNICVHSRTERGTYVFLSFFWGTRLRQFLDTPLLRRFTLYAPYTDARMTSVRQGKDHGTPMLEEPMDQDLSQVGPRNKRERTEKRGNPRELPNKNPRGRITKKNPFSLRFRRK